MNNFDITPGYRIYGDLYKDITDQQTQQELDDIITCAATKYIRADYSLNYKYTDLNKYQNFNGFESGVFCLYPNYHGTTFISERDYCHNDEWFIKNFLNGDREKANSINYFDLRCREWYQLQHRNHYSTFGEVYQYSSGPLGISNCVPLWSYKYTDKFYGAYCLDQFPTSEDTSFISKYYDNERGLVDYIIVNKDKAWEDGEYMTSNVTKYINALVFNKEGLNITSIELENVKVNAMDKYRDSFHDKFKYDLDKIKRLPTEPVKLGYVTVTKLDDKEVELPYIFIEDTFKIE